MKKIKLKDYFPLVEGSVWEYRRSGIDPGGSERLEVLSVTESGGRIEAQCRRTVVEGGSPTVSEFLAVKDLSGVYIDDVKEFPLPPTPGSRWVSPPVEFELESVEASVEVPAGRFLGCLKVRYWIAGGDGGSGSRVFAPGMGLVLEERSSESDPVTLSLISYRRP